jgi:hypothetical protein
VRDFHAHIVVENERVPGVYRLRGLVAHDSDVKLVLARELVLGS